MHFDEWTWRHARSHVLNRKYTGRQSSNWGRIPTEKAQQTNRILLPFWTFNHVLISPSLLAPLKYCTLFQILFMAIHHLGLTNVVRELVIKAWIVLAKVGAGKAVCCFTAPVSAVSVGGAFWKPLRELGKFGILKIWHFFFSIESCKWERFFPAKSMSFAKHCLFLSHLGELWWTISSWWFQPLWKILVKLDHFPRKGWK